MIEDLFVSNCEAGDSVASALDRAIANTATAVRQRLASGEDAVAVAESVGVLLRDAQKFGERILAIGSGLTDVILAIVLRSPDVTHVPSADCMAANLPQDREPTEEELREAWRICSAARQGGT
jgi:hypothetical protein